jgi:hypothetical protein
VLTEKGRERHDTDTRILYGHRLYLSISLDDSLSLLSLSYSIPQRHRFSYAGYNEHGYMCLTTTRMEVIKALASFLVHFSTMHRCISATRLRCVSVLMIFHAVCTVARNSRTFDMAERHELPDHAPCGANCLESGRTAIQGDCQQRSLQVSLCLEEDIPC